MLSRVRPPLPAKSVGKLIPAVSRLPPSLMTVTRCLASCKAFSASSATEPFSAWLTIALWRKFSQSVSQTVYQSINQLIINEQGS